MADPNDVFVGLLGETIDYVKVAEKLGALGDLIVYTATQAGELVQKRPDLAPELLAAVQALQAANDALGRAHLAVVAISETRSDALVASLNEGGPS